MDKCCSNYNCSTYYLAKNNGYSNLICTILNWALNYGMHIYKESRFKPVIYEFSLGNN